jgi:putative tryptophan/tyrosine transport system substrate-binding protein
VNKREFITMLGGTAVVWPLGGHAQQSMPVVGFLQSASPGPYASLVQAFRDGLGQTDFIEGRKMAIEYRWAEGHYDRLPAMAADLVARKVSVLAASGGIPAALAAKAATTTIPIVFLMGTDPIKAGVVTSPQPARRQHHRRER